MPPPDRPLNPPPTPENPSRVVITPEADDFIHRFRTELCALGRSLSHERYRDLVCYFHGFFSEEDRATYAGADTSAGDDDDNEGFDGEDC